MSDEEQGGAQQTTPTEEAQPQKEPASVPEPTQEPGLPPEVAQTYEGKKPEELAKMHWELSKKLGEQGQVIGSLKDLVEELRAGREATKPDPFQTSYEPTQTTPKEPAETQYDEGDYLTVGTAKKLLGDILSKRDEVTQKQAVQQNLQKAAMAHAKGKQIMKENPKLFEGIERDVESTIVNYYKSYALGGADVSQYLQDPNVWKKTAISMRIDRGEWDRVVPDKINPVRPTSTEEPASTKPYSGGEAPVEIDYESRDIQDFCDAMENETGRRPTKKEVEEIIGRGKEVWRGDNVLTSD